MIKQYHELGLVSDICLDKTYKAGTIKFKSRNPRFKWEQEFRIRRKNPRMLFVSPAPQFTGYMWTASLTWLFVTGLLILVVYIIAHCSSLNRTTFFSLYVCCPVLDLTLFKTKVESEDPDAILPVLPDAVKIEPNDNGVDVNIKVKRRTRPLWKEKKMTSFSHMLPTACIHNSSTCPNICELESYSRAYWETRYR
jgi:hypothetical protein